MSIIKRGKVHYLKVRVVDRQVMVRTPAQSKSEARMIEMAILTACRSGDYRALDPKSREVCVKLFQNQGWATPPDLGGAMEPQEELTLWKSTEMFLNYPTVKDAKCKDRYVHCLTHLVRHFGKDRPVKSIWVPELREFQVARLNEGFAPGTVNWQLSCFSRMFSVLIELQHVQVNPVRLVKRLSTKLGERQVYLSRDDVERIASHCPSWYRPLIWTGYYTGMRRGEILGLTRKQVNLSKRMIFLGPDDTKEGNFKRVPVHCELVFILEQTLRTPVLGSDKVFFLQDEKGIRPLGLETFKNPWERGCEALRKEERENARPGHRPTWEKPWPRFHDLRHTWKTNARRSGIDPEIRESILGHSLKERSVIERYGVIGDAELLNAIDSMTFDHGETQISAVQRKKMVAKW